MPWFQKGLSTGPAQREAGFREHLLLQNLTCSGLGGGRGSGVGALGGAGGRALTPRVLILLLIYLVFGSPGPVVNIYSCVCMCVFSVWVPFWNVSSRAHLWARALSSAWHPVEEALGQFPPCSPELPTLPSSPDTVGPQSWT